jgi:tungstate transport system substrate-binding protein
VVPAAAVSVVFILGLLAAGCQAPAGQTAAPRPDQKEVILATTTSAQDSGLLDVLLPIFESQTGYQVKVLAGGSGQALAMAERGEVDVVLAHSPDREKEIVDAGVGLGRRPVMHNDFIVVGPPSDPAGVKAAAAAAADPGDGRAAAAFKAIASEQAPFVSRGDQSGTHVKELDIWTAAGIAPAGQPWYQECGAGMAQALNIASEKAGYALADRGTFLSLRDTLALVILCAGDPALINRYSVLQVNPGRFDRVNGPGGKALADFLVSPAAREVIRTLGVDRFGEPLFYPDSE